MLAEVPASDAAFPQTVKNRTLAFLGKVNSSLEAKLVRVMNPRRDWTALEGIPFAPFCVARIVMLDYPPFKREKGRVTSPVQLEASGPINCARISVSKT